MKSDYFKGRYQLVLWWHWVGFRFERATHGLSVVYDWYLYLGLFEVRRWCKDPDGALKRYDDYYDKDSAAEAAGRADCNQLPHE